MPYPLLSLLLSNKCLNNFLFNCIKCTFKGSHIYIQNKLSSSGAVDYAFMWITTEEGYNFWHDIDCKYKDIYEKEKNLLVS